MAAVSNIKEPISSLLASPTNSVVPTSDSEDIKEHRNELLVDDGRCENPETVEEKMRSSNIVGIPDRPESRSVRDSGADTDSENGSSEMNNDSKIPAGDSSDSGHDSIGVDDEDDASLSANKDGVPTVRKIDDGATESKKAQNNKKETVDSDVEVIKNAMKNIKLVSKSKKSGDSCNRILSPVESNRANVDSATDVCARSSDVNISSIINTNRGINTNIHNTNINTKSSTPNTSIYESSSITNTPNTNASNSNKSTNSNTPDTNSSTNKDNSLTNKDNSLTNKDNSLTNSDGDSNSTNRHDDTSRYFTIIHDLPRDRPCKKCPLLPGSWKQWWRLWQNLFPRPRYTGRIAAVVVGSVVLLLTVFLLARIPSSRDDVSQPTMYDLPEDDAFRPPGENLHHPEGEMSGLQLLLHRHDRIGPPPGSEAHLRELARRHGVALHPELGVPVDEEYIKLEKDRKFKLAQMRAAAKKKDMKEVLEMVKDTIEDERSQMKDKEKFWSKDVTPLRILLVSTWRSGSTFLGQAILQHPGVFEHYEPFSYAGIRQIRSGTEAFQSQQFLHRLLECRFSGQDRYLNYTRQYPQDMIGHNKRIWGPCSKTRRVDLCSNATFLTEACNMFPIQLVKSVRLRLNLTQLFLGETRLNAKVIFLIRDPRATMNSRRSSVSWCESSPDCSSPEILCSDLREDLKVAAALERLYPNSFTMLRYEDLANDPQNVLKKLFDFLGMYYSKTMADFVSKHTESEVEKPWSIARKSAARVSRWKEKMKPDEIQEIESVCKTVIEKLNYELVGQK